MPSIELIGRVNPRIHFDPFRAVDWRYRRILALEQDDPGAVGARRQNFKSYDDSEIREGRVHYILRHSDNPETLDKQFESNVGCYMAFQIHDHPDDDLRKIIEARLLARQDDKDIADLCGTIPEAIFWYEKLFFNVRDRLNSKDWVVRQILTPSLDLEKSTLRRPIRDRQVALRYFGYFGGPLILDAMFYGFGNQAWPERVADIGRWMETQAVFAMKAKATAAAQALEVGDWNVMQVFETFAKLIELERDVPAGTASNDIEANVVALLREVKITVGSIEGEGHDNSATLGMYDKMPADLRDCEILQATRGFDIHDSAKEQFNELVEVQDRLTKSADTPLIETDKGIETK